MPGKNKSAHYIKGDSAERDVLAFIEKAADLEEWKE